MPHSLLLEAQRQAEKLHRYCIMRTHDGVMVWRFTDQWVWDTPFNTREEAEQYLFLKLPAIEGER